nr:hypothetical protein [Polyangiaceae bacterium]
MVRSPVCPRRAARFVGPALALFVMFVAACGEDKKPSRWDGASSARPAAPASGAPPAAEGGAFNRFFPAEGAEGTKRIFTQEKTGYAEAKLQKDGKDLATLSISDTNANPEARAKFESSSENLRGHRLMTVGKNQTTVLVKDRFQIKVSSPSLDDPARREWLGRFDFAGLERLAAGGLARFGRPRAPRRRRCARGP